MYRVTTGRSSKFLTTVYRSELPLKTCGNNNKPFKRSQQGFYIYIMDALVKQSIAVSSDSSSSMKITEV